MKTSPPTVEDFKSHQELGVVFRRPLDPEAQRISRGVSVSDDPMRLRSKLATYPELGRFLVTLRIDDGSRVQFEKTTKRRDHYTLWGSASDILACVERIEPA